jgi:hypothetical protein
MKQWGVGLRADDWRRRGYGGRSIFYHDEGQKINHPMDMGADAGGSSAASGGNRNDSQFTGSFGFLSRHQTAVKPIHGMPSGKSVSYHAGTGDQLGDVVRVQVDDMVNQVPSIPEGHIGTQLCTVGVPFSDHVDSGEQVAVVTRCGSHREVHVGVVATGNMEVGSGDASGGLMQCPGGEHVKTGVVGRGHIAMDVQEVESDMHASKGEENMGLNMDTSHVASHVHDAAGRVHDVAGGVALGRGLSACSMHVHEGSVGESGDHGQYGYGGMEVEQMSPVGRKSLRQWNKRARSPKAGLGKNSTTTKALGKRQGATRLVGKGELPKKRKSAQECMVVYATKIDLAGPVVQSYQPK